MAWNEPPVGNEQNPFDKKKDKIKKQPTNNNEDLLVSVEEKLDKLKEKFMRRGNDDGNGSNNKSIVPSRKLVVGGLLLAFAIWLLTGIYIVEPPERGVVIVLGKYKQETLAGPHWNWPTPIGRVEIVNVDQIRNAEIGYRSTLNNSTVNNVDVNSESLMLTKDENIVDVKIAVQYNVKSASNYLFNVRNPDNTLHQALESALREVVGQNLMDFLLTEGRNQIVAETRELGQSILDKYKSGLQISSVNLQDAQPPEQVQPAFNDVVKAREDKQRVINEAEAYANDIVPKARGAAARIVEEAIGYKNSVIANAEGDASRFISIQKEYSLAPEVTRNRMYLDAIEFVLSNTTKIMINENSGNNLTLLPLEKLIQAGGAQAFVNKQADKSSFSTNTQPNSSNRTRSQR